MAKNIKSYLYTQGKFGKGFRETVDIDNKFLYSKGKYKTKITADDLPEDYIKIHSRVIWYMEGYLKTSGIVDMQYRWVKITHFFKDDSLYISYKHKLEEKKDKWGFIDYVDYDVCICGNDIPHIILAAEKYSNFDACKVKPQIEDKRIGLRDNHPYDYDQCVGEDRDIFSIWKDKGYL